MQSPLAKRKGRMQKPSGDGNSVHTSGGTQKGGTSPKDASDNSSGVPGNFEDPRNGDGSMRGGTPHRFSSNRGGNS